MNTAITGATGHVGANLARALIERGHRVRALVYEDGPSLAGLDVDRVRGDVLEPETLRAAFSGIEVVYHAAAVIFAGRGGVEALRRVNIEGTANVVAACRACGVRRLVHFSSIEAISPYPAAQPVDESRRLCDEDPGAPAYARSKAEAQRVIERAAADGLDTVVLHPAGVLGPHDYGPSAMGRVLLDLCTGRLPVLVGGGFNWVDARDVCAAAAEAARRAAPGARYLLAGHYLSVADLARLVDEVRGTRRARWVAPLWAAHALTPAAALRARLTGRPTRLTPAALYALRHFRAVDTAKAAAELGFAPRPLSETVRDTLDWFAAAGRLPVAASA